MTDYADIDEKGWRFFRALFESTHADTTAQASMYDIGAAMGLDRDAASKTAQILIGWGLVEIKTLSGAISITDDGINTAQSRFGGNPDALDTPPTLSDAPIVTGNLCKAVEEMVMTLKTQTVRLGLSYDDLEALMADLKTIDAQMTSPRPKTAILREVFRSVRTLCSEAGAEDLVRKIGVLIGV